MRARAKVTSKGQVTVPGDVRRALGVETGDVLVFELKADYAVVRRAASLREVRDELHARYADRLRDRGYPTEREAIEGYIRERVADEDLGELRIVGAGGERAPGDGADG